MVLSTTNRSCPAIRNGWCCAVCTFEITSDRYILVTNDEGFAVPVHPCCYCKTRDRLSGVISPVHPNLCAYPNEAEIRASVAGFKADGMIQLGPSYPIVVSA